MIHGKISFGNKIRIFMIASACLMLAVLLAGSYIRTDHEKELAESLYFEYRLNGEALRFGLWEDEETEVYHLFLPSFFAENVGEFLLRYEDGKGTVKIDGVSYRDGDPFTGDSREEIHRLEFLGPLGRVYGDKGLRVLVSENVPALMFTAQDKEDLLSIEEFANKKYIETGSLVMLDERGNIVCKESLKKLKVRGNLTATLDKKPLSFSFYTPLGLCGMAPGIKWNLLANATDGSYLRNKLVLDLANESISGYEPDGAFVEVYLNGGYQGLYLLTEAVEIAENRVEVQPEESWFLEMELDFRMEEDIPYVITDKGQIFAVHTETGITEAEKEKIRDRLNDIERALDEEGGVSRQSDRALEELIDLESWAEAFLVQEISGDHDTGIASQFAIAPRKENAPLYAGPVWDFDGTMGNVNTAMFKNPAALTASVEQSRPEGNVNQNRWFAALYQNAQFRAVVEEKYKSVFRGSLEEILNVKIKSYTEEIERPAVLDAFRWHEKRLGWMFVLPEDLAILPEWGYGDYAQLQSHVRMAEEFLIQKKDFLDRLWIEHRDFCIVEVENNIPVLNQDYNQTLYYWVERGTPLQGLPEFADEDGNPYVYVDSKTGEAVFDGAIIWEDCILEPVILQ